ncbi:MAG: hypothetical protein R2764_07790 [Bacteroidales bacterium]
MRGEHNIHTPPVCDLLYYGTIVCATTGSRAFRQCCWYCWKNSGFRDAHENFDALAMKRFTDAMGLIGFMFSLPDKAYYCFKLEPISGVLHGREVAYDVTAIKG